MTCRLVLDISTRHVSAYVEHNSGVRVMEASTKEFGIARHLHKTCNVSAAHNIGRVLGHRLCQVGLVRVMWEDQYRTRKHQKVALSTGVGVGMRFCMCEHVTRLQIFLYKQEHNTQNRILLMEFWYI